MSKQFDRTVGRSVDYLREVALRRFKSWFVALATVTLAISAAGAVTAAPHKGEATRVNVRIGGTMSLLYLPLYVAAELGYLAKAGANASFPVVPNTAPALINGDIQLSLNGSDSAFLLAAQKKPAPIIVTVQQHNALSLSARTDLRGVAFDKPYPLNIRSLPKGFTVATTVRGGGAETFIAGVLGNAGLEEGRDYSVIVIPSGAGIAAAIKAGRIDVAMAFPPFDGIINAPGGGGRYLVQEARGQGPPDVVARYGTALLGNKTWVSKNRPLAKRIVAAVVRAQKYMHVRKNKPRLIAIAKKYTGISETAAISSALNYVIPLASPEIKCARLRAQAKLLLKVGGIDVIPPCGDLRDAALVPKTPIKPVLK